MPEHFNAGSLGQIQIEQNEIGARRTVIRVSRVDKFDGALAIAHHVKAGRNHGCDGFPHQKQIRLIVVNEENLRALLHICTMAGTVK